MLTTKRVDLTPNELQVIRTLIGLGLSLLEEEPLGLVEKRLLRTLRLKGVIYDEEALTPDVVPDGVYTLAEDEDLGLVASSVVD